LIERLGKQFMNDQMIIKKLLNFDACKSGKYDIYYFITTVKNFPEFKDTILTFILSDKDLFEGIMKNAAFLAEAVKAFPEYKSKFLSMLISDIRLFKAIVPNTYYLALVVRAYKSCQDDVFSYLLSQRPAFESIVKDEYALKQIAKIFPKYKRIFEQNDVEKTWQLGQKLLTQRAAVMIAQGARGKENFFHNIPREINKLIIAKTGFFGNEKQRYQYASDIYQQVVASHVKYCG
jgi:hypothetical protein